MRVLEDLLMAKTPYSQPAELPLDAGLLAQASAAASLLVTDRSVLTVAAISTVFKGPMFVSLFEVEIGDLGTEVWKCCTLVYHLPVISVALCGFHVSLKVPRPV